MAEPHPILQFFCWKTWDKNQQTTTSSCQLEGTFKEIKCYNCRKEHQQSIWYNYWKLLGQECFWHESRETSCTNYKPILLSCASNPWILSQRKHELLSHRKQSLQRWAHSCSLPKTPKDSSCVKIVIYQIGKHPFSSLDWIGHIKFIDNKSG